MSDETHVPSAQPPIETETPQMDLPATAAGGVASLVSTMKQLRHAGPVRSIKALLKLNQADGFQCPGCAWPEPEKRGHLEFCEQGARAVAEELNPGRLDERFFQKYSVAALSQQSDYWLTQQGRLSAPMWLAPGATHYAEISWDAAFELIAQELHTLASPNEAVFYTSGRTSNEAAFMYQLFARAFGTNNLPDSSNMCHESSSFAVKAQLGSSKGTVRLEDFAQADLIFLIGQNPGTNHPRMLRTLQEAARRGCNIIAINPMREAGLVAFKDPQEWSGLVGDGTPLTRLFLQVRSGGDLALFKGINKAIVEYADAHAGVGIDTAFIDGYTDGFAEYKNSLLALSWTAIEQQAGISAAQIQEVAQQYRAAKNVICCWAMGITQHQHAVATIHEIVHLLMLGGHLGRPGAGLCPVRGHSNVQGDRTMGVTAFPTDDFLDRLEAHFDIKMPREPGYHTVSAIHAMEQGQAKVFIALGGNFLSASPDTEYTAAAMQKNRLTVQISTKLNRGHLITGKQALILPRHGRSEQDLQHGLPQCVTTENSMGYINRSEGQMPPPSAEVKSEVAIVAEMAQRTLGDAHPVPWKQLGGDYAAIRECIAATIPGFENFNQDLERHQGFYLPHPVRHRQFHTDTGRAHFFVHRLETPSLAPDQFALMTVRSHDQFNTTIYGLDDRYRGIHNGRRVVFINDEDLAQAGWEAGTVVDITSHFNGTTRVASHFRLVPFALPRRCLAAYYPETNVLVALDHVADGSFTPVSKFVVVTLARAKSSM